MKSLFKNFFRNLFDADKQFAEFGDRVATPPPPPRYVHIPVRFTCLHAAVGEAMTIAKRRNETITLKFGRFPASVSPTSTREEIYAAIDAQDPRTNEERINASVAMVNAYKRSIGQPPLDFP